MRVDPSGTHPPLAGTQPNTGPRAAAKAAEPAGATGPTPDAGPFAPTGELARLLDLVRQSPEVRTDAVQGAATKLASGELTTPEAAADAARAMLDSNELPSG